MITLEFARTMARYNRWQNRSLVTAADSLSDEERWKNRGAFFGSIAQTLNHILWDDRIWLARLRRDRDNEARIGVHHPYTDDPNDWSVFVADRAALDDEIVVWANALTDAELTSDVSWMRGDEDVVTNFGFNLAHMINHQTHHRGQVHAMLTAAGVHPEATDLQMLKIIEGESPS
ncbi:DinB family protein [uncultured Roseobacter sp.]|uniref:DinB family protein n=1 Tax=uncultured Roseobacter sp. TaxID=114847 RepID=UPI00260DB376|nr:DinB family protein [uncultured Roseobacter sp.]